MSVLFSSSSSSSGALFHYSQLTQVGGGGGGGRNCGWPANWHCTTTAQLAPWRIGLYFPLFLAVAFARRFVLLLAFLGVFSAAATVIVSYIFLLIAVAAAAVDADGR